LAGGSNRASVPAIQGRIATRQTEHPPLDRDFRRIDEKQAASANELLGVSPTSRDQPAGELLVALIGKIPRVRQVSVAAQRKFPENFFNLGKSRLRVAADF
jgi:hypothetical protein